MVAGCGVERGVTAPALTGWITLRPSFSNWKTGQNKDVYSQRELKQTITWMQGWSTPVTSPGGETPGFQNSASHSRDKSSFVHVVFIHVDLLELLHTPLIDFSSDSLLQPLAPFQATANWARDPLKSLHTFSSSAEVADYLMSPETSFLVTVWTQLVVIETIYNVLLFYIKKHFIKQQLWAHIWCEGCVSGLASTKTRSNKFFFQFVFPKQTGDSAVGKPALGAGCFFVYE